MRLVSRLFCLALTIVALAVGVVVLVEIGLRLLSREPWLVSTSGWFDELTTATPDSVGVRVALIVAIAVGVVFLAVAWAPRRPVSVPTDLDREGEVNVRVRRKDLQGHIERRIRDVPYVTEATVTARPTRIDVQAASTRGAVPGVADAVQTKVRDAAVDAGLGEYQQRVRIHKSAERAA